MLGALGVWQVAVGLPLLVLSLQSPSLENPAVIGLSLPRLAVSFWLALASAAGLALAASSRARREPPRWLSLLLRGNDPTFVLALCLFAITSGALVVGMRLAGVGTAIAASMDRLLPIAGWLVFSGLGVAAAVFAIAPGSKSLLHFVTILFILLAALFVELHIWPALESHTNDIYYTYLEGGRLQRGENPYARILEADAIGPQKYPTYLPLFYFASAGVQAVGFSTFEQWIVVWRMVFFVASAFIASCIYYLILARGPALAAFGALFWLFNRWTLHVGASADLDFLPLAILVLSVGLVPKNARPGLFLFGVSVAIKHVAIFLLPVLLLIAGRRSPRFSWRQLAGDVLAAGVVPILAALPFIVWQPRGFFESILYSVTRDPIALGDIGSIDLRLGWTGSAARLPMLALVLLACVGTWRGRLGPFSASLLVMGAVVFFNSVFFTSYMVWMVPFLLLAALEALPPALRSGAGGDRFNRVREGRVGPG